MEIELNFRLDEHGRTSKTSDTNLPSSDAPCSKTLDYQPKSIRTNLVPPSGENSSSHRQWLDDLLLDCQISDSGLMPRTFWVPAKGMKPRCNLEQMALDVFHHHVPADLDYDATTSGAEWWAQIRPSPDGTGRYAMLDDQPDELSRTGISFHWDKDEDLRLLTGGTTYVHPHLSTVTYLTDLGSPTLALNHRVHSLTGDWIEPSVPEGFVSWPCTGKHLSFDGRYLHAAPADLMEDGAWEQQLELPIIDSSHRHQDDASRKREEKIQRRRHRRVTFLVNVWLNYKPFDVQPFPDTMIDKLSGIDESTRRTLNFVTDTDPTSSTCATKSKHMTASAMTESQHHTFTWPMGDCDSKEFIEIHMPLQETRQQASTGGNLRIHWEPNTEKNYSGVRLYKETTGEAVNPKNNDESQDVADEKRKCVNDESLVTDAEDHNTKRMKSSES